MYETPITLQFDNRVEDHVAAERLYERSTGLARVDRGVALALLVVGVLGTWRVGARWWTLIWFPLAFLEWFHLLSIRPLMIRRWFRGHPKFSETYHLAFDRTGIHFTTRSIDSHVTWEHYTRVLEDDRLWLLIYGARMYTVIPKRAFVNDAERARFRALVHEQIVSRRTPLA